MSMITLVTGGAHLDGEFLSSPTNAYILSNSILPLNDVNCTFNIRCLYTATTNKSADGSFTAMARTNYLRYITVIGAGPTTAPNKRMLTWVTNDPVYPDGYFDTPADTDTTATGFNPATKTMSIFRLTRTNATDYSTGYYLIVNSNSKYIQIPAPDPTTGENPDFVATTGSPGTASRFLMVPFTLQPSTTSSTLYAYRLRFTALGGFVQSPATASSGLPLRLINSESGARALFNIVSLAAATYGDNAVALRCAFDGTFVATDASYQSVFVTLTQATQTTTDGVWQLLPAQSVWPVDATDQHGCYVIRHRDSGKYLTAQLTSASVSAALYSGAGNAYDPNCVFELIRDV